MKAERDKNVWERLRDVRGITQDDVARVVRKSQQHVSQFENGKRRVRRSERHLYQLAYNLTEAEFEHNLRVATQERELKKSEKQTSLLDSITNDHPAQIDNIFEYRQVCLVDRREVKTGTC